MLCNYCKKDNPSENAFCIFCGAPINKIQPSNKNQLNLFLGIIAVFLAICLSLAAFGAFPALNANEQEDSYRNSSNSHEETVPENNVSSLGSENSGSGMQDNESETRQDYSSDAQNYEMWADYWQKKADEAERDLEKAREQSNESFVEDFNYFGD